MGKAIESTNPWIRFCAKKAIDFGISYACATTDQRVKDAYLEELKRNPIPTKPRAPRKPRASKAKPISYDMPPAPYGARPTPNPSTLLKAKRADAASRAMALMKGVAINKVTDLATAKFPRRRRLKKMSDPIDPRSPEARGWNY